MTYSEKQLADARARMITADDIDIAMLIGRTPLQVAQARGRMPFVYWCYMSLAEQAVAKEVIERAKGAEPCTDSKNTK